MALRGSMYRAPKSRFEVASSERMLARPTPPPGYLQPPGVLGSATRPARSRDANAFRNCTIDARLPCKSLVIETDVQRRARPGYRLHVSGTRERAARS